jgi:uncharacterized protein
MKYMGMILMSIVSIAIMIGAVIYLTNRFAVYFPSLSNKNWLWIFGSITFVMMFGQAFSVTPNAMGRIIAMFGSLATGILLYLLLSVIALELINLIYNILPNLRGIITLALTTICFGIGIFNAYSLKVTQVEIPIKGLTKEIRAVHLTDIHLGNFRGSADLSQIVDKIGELQPDVIFNTGDLFDSKSYFNDSVNVLNPFLRLKVPQYFVYGNHDVYVGVDDVIKRMTAVNAIVLQNEISNFGELQIVGLNNMPKDKNTFDVHATPGSETIESVLTKLSINESRPTLVLHHRPEGVEYMNAKKTDLLLAGHTHAGQMMPITYIARLMFKYNQGLYKFKDLKIYVSEGVGTLFAPLRLGTKSEITLLKLIPQK